MKTQAVCHVCGSNPCYLICPMQDPYAGNPLAEHEDHEFNSRYDNVREMYAGTGDNLEEDRDFEAGEAEAEMVNNAE